MLLKYAMMRASLAASASCIPLAVTALAQPADPATDSSDIIIVSGQKHREWPEN